MLVKRALGGKILAKSLILAVFLGSIAFVSPALAYYPTLTATSQGSGSILLSVNGGNPNSQIDLSSKQTGSLWTVVSNIGRTDYNGYFSQVVSMPSDGTNNVIQLYVTVGGQQSSTVSVYSNGGCYSTSCGGCTYNCGGGLGGLSFSQTNPSLTVGQSANITITTNVSGVQYYQGNYYVSTNSNSNVVTAYVNGQSLNLYGNTSGSSTIVVCQTNSSSSCGTLYVTVTGGSGCYSNCGGSLTFSPSTVSVNVGQTATVTAYNTSGSLYVSSNSNSAIATASVSGNQINVYGYSAGSTSAVICSSNSSSCGTLYITVGNGSSYGFVTLSPSTLNLTYPQTSTVSISSNNYGGSYYVSSNSNSGVASASVSGNLLYVSPLTGGSTTINVCQSSSSSQCASVYVTVNGGGGCYSNCGSSLSLSQSNLTMTSGQTTNINIYGSGSYYVSSNSNIYAATASISGNSVNIYGVQNGNSSVVICQNINNACVTLYVTVTGSSSIYGSLYLSQASLNINVGQTSTVSVSGNGGNVFYLGSNTNSSVASANINGNIITVYGLRNGTANLQVCQNNTGGCVTLYASVGNPTSSGGGLQYPGGSVLGASTYPNGQLIGENGTVYIVYKNTKTGFSSGSVFTGLGFKFVNVIQVGASGLISSGYTVNNSYSSHPWGSWIKSGSTVYFVHDSGLIPVPNWDTFLNNGGSANLIVSANIYDLRLPTLSPMTYGDSRLQ